MAEPTKRPWHDGSGTIAVWYGGEFAKLSQDNYRYAAKCVNAIHAARITHAEELVVFLQLLEDMPLRCDRVRFHGADTECGQCDPCRVMNSLDRLTATVSTEGDDAVE